MTDPYLEINKGQRGGEEPVVVFGINDDIDTGSVPEDIISQGGMYAGFNAIAAQLLDIVSGNINDTAAGTGARDVLIFGLDENYDEISERVALDGTTPVKTLKSYLRVNFFMVDNVGSLERNNGIITATQETSTFLMSNIQPTVGIAHQAVYTVPNKKALVPKSLNVNLNGLASETGEDAVEVREVGKAWRQFFVSSLSQGGGGHNLDLNVTRVLKEKSDLRIKMLDVGDNNSSASARFSFILVPMTSVKFPVIPAEF